MMTEALEKKECLRCNRPFTPKKPDQKYGEKCLRKMAGQTMLQEKYVVPPRKKRIKKKAAEVIECRDENGEVTAVII